MRHYCYKPSTPYVLFSSVILNFVKNGGERLKRIEKSIGGKENLITITLSRLEEEEENTLLFIKKQANLEILSKKVDQLLETCIILSEAPICNPALMFLSYM